MTTAPRMAAIWCPDWPVTIARLEHDLEPSAPVAVLTANRVVACSHTARQQGIVRGLRRREAQGRCPELIVVARNEAAEARGFEPVLAAIESIAPGVEVGRPGLAAIGIKGPTRYFGGETAVLHALSRTIGEHTDDVLIGVADGAFAAEQAARRGSIIPSGASPEFLASLPVETLDEPELVDLLKRLGLRTLGAFAALPAADVQARFGPAGAWAHRQAGGVDARPIAARRPPVEFEVSVSFDPPLDRVDAIAFSARGAVEKFVSDLADHGLACTCFELIAHTDRGDETVRRWRHTGVLSAMDVTDRIRWQLEGWLNRGSGEANAPRGPITLLRLSPIDTVATGVHQRALWGADGAADERTHRALARVQTLLGHGSVTTPVVAGGRGPAQRTQLVPWGDDRPELPDQPWPGSLPSPAPSVLLRPPRPIQVLDGAGRSVVVTERGMVPMSPHLLRLGDDGPEQSTDSRGSTGSADSTGSRGSTGSADSTGSTGSAGSAISAWAGPWPVDERWWDQQAHRQLVRMQLVDAVGKAYLVCFDVASRRWFLEGMYD